MWVRKELKDSLLYNPRNQLNSTLEYELFAPWIFNVQSFQYFTLCNSFPGKLVPQNLSTNRNIFNNHFDKSYPSISRNAINGKPCRQPDNEYVKHFTPSTFSENMKIYLKIA